MKTVDDLHGACIRTAADLIRLGDRVEKRGDPAYDRRPELVDRECVVMLALRLRDDADAVKRAERFRKRREQSGRWQRAGCVEPFGLSESWATGEDVLSVWLCIAMEGITSDSCTADEATEAAHV